MQESLSPASLVLFLSAWLGSFGALFYLFQKHVGGAQLVAYEPRQRVPWGPGIAVIAVLFPLLGILTTLLQSEVHEVEPPIVEQTPEVVVSEQAAAAAQDARDFIINGIATSGMMFAFVAVVGAFLVMTHQATRDDLGIPANRQTWFRDIRIGFVACLASILPVFVMQLVLTIALEPETDHPILEELQQTHTTAMMLVSVLMVVIAAPLCEEFAFRLLLQGWLERFEDDVTHFTATQRLPLQSVEPEMLDSSHAGQETTEANEEPLPTQPSYPSSSQNPREILPGLPHGWFPILVSGTIFGLAHWGHGVSPVPLVLFGIVLGYLYQRTHRLVAPVVCHALFNGYSMTLLWLNLK